jgi:hypothetical protein
MWKQINAAHRLMAAMLAVLLLMVAFAGATLAHEGREVGEYILNVGFVNEPAVVEQPNGLDLRVEHGHGGESEPVEGLENTLNAEIIFGDERLPLDVRPQYGEPGAYTADIIPTEPGTYSFRIYGTIDGTQIDETFVGGTGTFSEVAGLNAMTFPKQIDTVGNVQQTASDASDTASTAMMLGVAGVAFGLLGTAIAVVAFMRMSAVNRQRSTVSGAVAPDATD